MNELEKLEKRKKSTRHILITVSVLFLFLMLVLPLLCIIASSLKEGFAFYMQSIRTDYVKSALKVTLIATVAAVVINTFFGLCVSWLLTKFSFRGKQVLATLIDIPFSISPVIVGLAFLMTFGRLGWTYPFIRADVYKRQECRPTTGNAGTGKCQRGAFEHGCEYAPVAGTDERCYRNS